MMLPAFVIAGVPRSGTTTLAAQLRLLPQIYLPARKELHYFTINRGKGLNWYAEHFAAASPRQLCGESTPTYLLHADAVRRMADTLPDAKVIILLRDPVARAYSHFRLNQWKGIERLDFDGALAAEPRRLERDPTGASFAYAGSGDYVRMLRVLFAHYPRDQVHVMFFDDLVAHPGLAIERVCRFLGLPIPSAPVSTIHRNHRGAVRIPAINAAARRLPGPLCRAVRRFNTKAGDYPPMPNNTRRMLTTRFMSTNAELATLLGCAVPWMREDGFDDAPIR